MSKKILIACVLVMTMIFSFATMSYAAGTPTVTIGNISGSAGDEVDVEITVSNNPGFIAAGFRLYFDKSRMQITGYSVDDSFLPDNGTSKKFTSANNTRGYHTFSLGQDDAEEDFIDDGNILTVTFELLEDIEATDTTAQLNIQKATFTNFDLASVNFTFENEAVAPAGKQAWLGYTNYADGSYLAIAKFEAGSTAYGINFDNYDFVADGANNDNIFAIEIQDLDAAPTGVTAFAR